MTGDGQPKLLAVDDEPDVVEGFAMLLEDALGARVLTASGGQEALDLLQRQDVDLVISDYKMPGMDGCTFLEAAHRARPDVPLVMVTAYQDDEMRRRAARIPVTDLLPKGIDPDEFVAAIQAALPR